MFPYVYHTIGLLSHPLNVRLTLVELGLNPNPSLLFLHCRKRAWKLDELNSLRAMLLQTLAHKEMGPRVQEEAGSVP